MYTCEYAPVLQKYINLNIQEAVNQNDIFIYIFISFLIF